MFEVPHKSLARLVAEEPAKHLQCCIGAADVCRGHLVGNLAQDKRCEDVVRALHLLGAAADDGPGHDGMIHLVDPQVVDGQRVLHDGIDRELLRSRVAVGLGQLANVLQRQPQPLGTRVHNFQCER